MGLSPSPPGPPLADEWAQGPPYLCDACPRRHTSLPASVFTGRTDPSKNTITRVNIPGISLRATLAVRVQGSVGHPSCPARRRIAASRAPCHRFRVRSRGQRNARFRGLMKYNRRRIPSMALLRVKLVKPIAGTRAVPGSRVYYTHPARN